MVIEQGFCFLAAGMLLMVPLPWVMGLALATAIHELGHYLALICCGIPVHRLRLGIGGAILETGPLGRREEIICALAGPAAGALLTLAAKYLPRTALCALCQTAWNLLPIGDRDGGRALRRLLDCDRAFRWAEWGSVAAVLAVSYRIRNIGLWAMVPAVAILAEKFLAKNHSRHYNRPTIDKEVRL